MCRLIRRCSGNRREGDYSIAKTHKDSRGTEITLHFREGEDEFLDDWRLRSVIGKYSDHIALPVEIESKMKKTAPLSGRKINKAQALWTRNKTTSVMKNIMSFTSISPMTLRIR